MKYQRGRVNDVQLWTSLRSSSSGLLCTKTSTVVSVIALLLSCFPAPAPATAASQTLLQSIFAQQQQQLGNTGAVVRSHRHSAPASARESRVNLKVKFASPDESQKEVTITPQMYLFQSRRTISGPDFSLPLQFSLQHPTRLVLFNFRWPAHDYAVFHAGKTVIAAFAGMRFAVPPGSSFRPPSAALNPQIFDFEDYVTLASKACESQEEAQINMDLLQNKFGVMHFAKYNLGGNPLLGGVGAHHGSILMDFPVVDFPSNRMKVLRMEVARGGSNVYSNPVPGTDAAHGQMYSYARLGYLLPDKTPKDFYDLANVVIHKHQDIASGYDLLSSNCLHFASSFAAIAVSSQTLNLQVLPQDADREIMKDANCLARAGNAIRQGLVQAGLEYVVGGAPLQQGNMPFDDLSKTQLKQNVWKQKKNKRRGICCG